jgi:serine/threonine protein kinase
MMHCLHPPQMVISISLCFVLTIIGSTLTPNELYVSPTDIECAESVGAGAYGEVWKGTWNGKGGGITAAIKKIKVAGVTDKIQREIYSEVNILLYHKRLIIILIFVDILTKLRHPNIPLKLIANILMLFLIRFPDIVQIYGACFTNTELWIVMEFMEGGSLYDVLHSDATIRWDARVR